MSRPKPDRRQTDKRRRMSAGERREIILQKAKEAFAARGYASTSLDDVAAAAGVTKPVVYDHFTSKRELYFALMRQLRDQLVSGATHELAADAPPAERFKAAIGSFFEQVKREPAIVELLFVQARTEPDLAQEWLRLQNEAMATLEPLARALAPKLEPWKLKVALHFLHHGLNATAAAWPRGASKDEMTKLVVSLLWNGVESVR
jgi:AcrR family transcriptional regulator